jgi:hypothetical protein
LDFQLTAHIAAGKITASSVRPDSPFAEGVMRLVQLESKKGAKCHFNPEHIVFVIPAKKDGYCEIVTTDGSYDVTGTVDEIAAKINDAMKS